MATEKNIPNLTINKVENQNVFDYLVTEGLVNENELYLIPGEAGGGVQDVVVYETGGSHSVVDPDDNIAYLGEASVRDVASTITANGVGLPTSKAVSDYVSTKTDQKVDISSINITWYATTLLSLTQGLVNKYMYARWICMTDNGSSKISDKPTGSTNASFVCEAYCNHYASASDWRYVLICWVQAQTSPYIAIVSNSTSSISWVQLIDNSSSQALTNKTYNGYTLAAACAKGVVTSVDTSANLPTSNAVKTFVEGKGYVTTDTKNTAGSTDTSSKIYLVGATSQAANPQTYSDNEVYATSGVLTTKSVQVGGTAATMQYNSTDKCIEFVFA